MLFISNKSFTGIPQVSVTTKAESNLSSLNYSLQYWQG